MFVFLEVIESVVDSQYFFFLETFVMKFKQFTSIITFTEDTLSQYNINFPVSSLLYWVFIVGRPSSGSALRNLDYTCR